jgi:hypothetical protein
MEHVLGRPETIFEMIGRVMRGLPAPNTNREQEEKIKGLQDRLRKLAAPLSAEE